MKKLLISIIIIILASLCFAENNTKHFSKAGEYFDMITQFYKEGTYLVICESLKDEGLKYKCIYKNNVKSISLIDSNDSITFEIAGEGFYDMKDYFIKIDKTGNIYINERF